MTDIDSSDQWQEWAALAQKGDKAAYRRLLGAIAPYIRNALVKSVSNMEEAEDITQEVLISVHKSLNTYTPDRPFKPWLFSIVNFRKMDYLRKYYAGRQDKTISTEFMPEKDNVTYMHSAYEIKDIETALDSFPEQQKRIFQMIKIEGYTAKEVSEELGMKESAVKVSAHRTMKKLQGMLK